MALTTPIAAAAAYRATAQVDAGQAPALPGGATAGGSFADALTRAAEGTVGTMHAADRAAEAGILGTASATEVVMAVARAELALQTTVAIRDRVVQAYQDVMRMPI